ncbi:hypothetical protein M405DRAFT_820456 [Rhizopogon salebrosus TDB-379]|nr:hypothetical protein M405DRAFT_820456 [Rhizopogon salebrosus TDB-379]
MSSPPPRAYQEAWKQRLAFTSPPDCRILTLLPPLKISVWSASRGRARVPISRPHLHTHPAQLLTVTPPT